jgi:hypothetical protein
MSLRRLAAALPDSFGPSRSHPRTLVCQLNLPDLDRFAGSSLLTLQKVARLMPFQVVQGGAKESQVQSLQSKVREREGAVAGLGCPGGLAEKAP